MTMNCVTPGQQGSTVPRSTDKDLENDRIWTDSRLLPTVSTSKIAEYVSEKCQRFRFSRLA